MSTKRLTFLYPPLFRSSRRQQVARITSTAAANLKRHGPAVDPKTVNAEAHEKAAPATTPPQQELSKEQAPQESQAPAETRASLWERKNASLQREQSPVSTTRDAFPLLHNESTSLSSGSHPPSSQNPSQSSASSFSSSTSSSSSGSSSEPPTLATTETTSSSQPARPPTRPAKQPDAVHYLDSYRMASTLSSHGFNPGQSALLSKILVSMLQSRLSSTTSSLVSRSRVENESYLFNAACSELRNEIYALHRSATEEMRVQRAAVKAEYEATATRFGQEIHEYRNAMQGMFDERKMEVRGEHRAMENKIQELNYKITVMIQSELKSDVEALRWVTTRRGLLAIGTLALIVVVGIKLNTKKKDDKKDEPHDVLISVADGVGLG